MQNFIKLIFITILNDNTDKKNNDYIYRIVINFHDFIVSHETNPASFFSSIHIFKFFT